MTFGPYDSDRRVFMAASTLQRRSFVTLPFPFGPPVLCLIRAEGERFVEEENRANDR